jgi:hypothetical protein
VHAAIRISARTETEGLKFGVEEEENCYQNDNGVEEQLSWACCHWKVMTPKETLL